MIGEIVSFYISAASAFGRSVLADDSAAPDAFAQSRNSLPLEDVRLAEVPFDQRPMTKVASAAFALPYVAPYVGPPLLKVLTYTGITAAAVAVTGGLMAKSDSPIEGDGVSDQSAGRAEAREAEGTAATPQCPPPHTRPVTPFRNAAAVREARDLVQIQSTVRVRIVDDLWQMFQQRASGISSSQAVVYLQEWEALMDVIEIFNSDVGFVKAVLGQGAGMPEIVIEDELQRYERSNPFRSRNSSTQPAPGDRPAQSGPTGERSAPIDITEYRQRQRDPNCPDR